MVPLILEVKCLKKHIILRQQLDFIWNSSYFQYLYLTEEMKVHLKDVTRRIDFFDRCFGRRYILQRKYIFKSFYSHVQCSYFNLFTPHMLYGLLCSHEWPKLIFYCHFSTAGFILQEELNKMSELWYELNNCCVLNELFSFTKLSFTKCTALKSRFLFIFYNFIPWIYYSLLPPVFIIISSLTEILRKGQIIYLICSMVFCK